jgi:tRNA threonylcarbamoyladenosine biosynthesis protein TsaB
MAIILLLETATEICSAAIGIDGNVIAVRETSEGFRHSEKLSVFIEEILAGTDLRPDQLDAVCVSRGPGSYTGLRIGVSVAKGICYARKIPLIAISTLDTLAHHVAHNAEEYNEILTNDTLLAPMIDARRMEVYTAVYDAGGEKTTEITAKIIGPASFEEELRHHPLFIFGNGAGKCIDTLRHENIHFLPGVNASARFMSELAEKRFHSGIFEDAAYFEPFYLKDFIATIPKDKIL